MVGDYIIQCKQGHKYKINKFDKDFRKIVGNGCPYCNSHNNFYKNNFDFSKFEIKDRTEYLDTLIRCLPHLFGWINNCTIYDDNNNKIDINNILITNSELNKIIRIKYIDSPFKDMYYNEELICKALKNLGLKGMARNFIKYNELRMTVGLLIHICIEAFTLIEVGEKTPERKTHELPFRLYDFYTLENGFNAVISDRIKELNDRNNNKTKAS